MRQKTNLGAYETTYRPFLHHFVANDEGSSLRISLELLFLPNRKQVADVECHETSVPKGKKTSDTTQTTCKRLRIA